MAFKRSGRWSLDFAGGVLLEEIFQNENFKKEFYFLYKSKWRDVTLKQFCYKFVLLKSA
jgi:hypothetical protein